MNDEFAIPVAHIHDIDLTVIRSFDPDIAEEITKLGELLAQGKETPEEFFRLVQLLCRVGQIGKAEYLLRRNWDILDDSYALYRQLFGTAKEEEFAAAVKDFAAKFSVHLEYIGSRGFLDSSYHMQPCSTRLDEFRLLNGPCEVRFDFASEEAVEAEVYSPRNQDYMVLRWVNGVWVIVKRRGG